MYSQPNELGVIMSIGKKKSLVELELTKDFQRDNNWYLK